MTIKYKITKFSERIFFQERCFLQIIFSFESCIVRLIIKFNYGAKITHLFTLQSTINARFCFKKRLLLCHFLSKFTIRLKKYAIDRPLSYRASLSLLLFYCRNALLLYICGPSSRTRSIDDKPDFLLDLHRHFPQFVSLTLTIYIRKSENLCREISSSLFSFTNLKFFQFFTQKSICNLAIYTLYETKANSRKLYFSISRNIQRSFLKSLQTFIAVLVCEIVLTFFKFSEIASH